MHDTKRNFLNYSKHLILYSNAYLDEKRSWWWRQHSPWPSSGSELLVVVMSLRPDSSDASASEDVSIVITSLASKYSATESATEGARWLCRPIEGVLCETANLH